MTQRRSSEQASAAYDRELVPWLFEHWADPFLDAADPAPSAQVLDLACGTGLIVRYLLRRLDQDGRVAAVDLDPEMVAYASTTVDDERVSWREADAARLPLAANSYDIVTCHQGLQFMPDPKAVLTEVQRVLRPNGRVAVATWGPLDDNPWPAALASATQTVLGDGAGEGMSIVSRLGDPGDVAAMLRNSGFEVLAATVHELVAHHPDVREAVHGQLAALPSGTSIGDLDQEGRDRLALQMCELLAPYTDATGRLEVPSTSVFVAASRQGAT